MGKILVRNFVEPWLGTLHLELIGEHKKDLSTVKIYKVVDTEEGEEDKVGGIVTIDQENGRTSGGESIEFIDKNVLKIINYSEKKIKQKPTLWEVLYMSHYIDGEDDRSQADFREYVTSDSRSNAIVKAMPYIEANISKRYHAGTIKVIKSNEKIEASVVALENLMIVRDSSNDARLGGYSINKFAKVEISDAEKGKFELKISLKKVK